MEMDELLGWRWMNGFSMEMDGYFGMDGWDVYGPGLEWRLMDFWRWMDGFEWKWMDSLG